MASTPPADSEDAAWNFDNSYTRLPGDLFARVSPVSVRSPAMVVFNTRLANALGLNTSALENPSGVATFAGNSLPPGADPIAQAYAGHQFGHLAMLGDGRAVLLGEHLTPDARRVDIQLKGSGQTPFSRRGDGRAALGPMLREYLISEAMAGLGIPTTRSLAVISTGEQVFRSEPLPGAVLTRVAASHIRVGTFEYAARIGQPETLSALANHTIARHYPGLVSSPDPYPALLSGVIDRQAALVARWMCVGFVHGVMNTDNVALSGETIDYGPCAFVDAYEPMAVFSSIDSRGRYAFANQPEITLWNLTRFAETLLTLLHPEPDQAVAKAEELLSGFTKKFADCHLDGMRAKLGLASREPDDRQLINDLLEWMHQTRADFTNFFRDLSPDEPASEDPAFHAWHRRWTDRLAKADEGPDIIMARMHAANPAVIPRNHRVEEALKAAVAQDMKPFSQLLRTLENPFDRTIDRTGFDTPAPPDAAPYVTYCGT